jgi:DNA/RNA endonuclease YhcR with UshA esterase domain
MNKLRILTGLILALTLMPLQAHHSTAMFDDQREITVTGIIKEFQYTNPHSWLIIDVTNDDGSVTTWGFEAEGPTTLTRSGIRKSTLPPGTKITITGHPMKDGRSAAAWVVAELEDGTVLNPRAGFVAR